MPAPRGRRPAGSGTRAAILAAATRQFGALGYPRTTLRAIAGEARVDTRLVTHYFGSKQELFIQVVELPFDTDEVVRSLMAEGSQGVGARLAAFAVGILETPRGRTTMTGLLRAAASEEEAAVLVRDLLVEQLLTPLTRLTGGDRPELRASLVGAQMAGLVFTRHVLALPGLAAATPEELVSALTPVLQHYLTGDLLPARA